MISYTYRMSWYVIKLEVVRRADLHRKRLVTEQRIATSLFPPVVGLKVTITKRRKNYNSPQLQRRPRRPIQQQARQEFGGNRLDQDYSFTHHNTQTRWWKERQMSHRGLNHSNNNKLNVSSAVPNRYSRGISTGSLVHFHCDLLGPTVVFLRLVPPFMTDVFLLLGISVISWFVSKN